MEQALDTCTLKTGEELHVAVVTAPDRDRRRAVERLLAHKGEEWRTHIAAALRGATDELETRFYLGLVDGVPVANVMTTEADGVGVLGHVFTRPERRRQGICSAVFGPALRDFAARDGRVLLLGTGFESPPYWIYHSYGFRSLRGGFMRYAAPGHECFEERWFDTEPAGCTAVKWKHLPGLALLASRPGTERLRSATWGVAGFGNLEWAGVRLMHDRHVGARAEGVVLDGANGAVLGCATAYAHRVGVEASYWPGAWVVDCFTHPLHDARVTDLVRALPELPGKQLSYVEAGHEWKIAALEAAGFRREGTLTGLLRVGEEASDIVVLGKGSA